jgi:hypothetical protein
VGGYFVSHDPLYDPANPNGYSYAGGDPINFCDPDGRLAKDMYQNGLPGAQMFGAAGNWLQGYADNSSSYWSVGADFTGQLFNNIAGMGTPANYVNSALHFGNNVNTLYREDGLVVAGSYALTSWNVGSIWEGYSNIDLATGMPVGDGFERANRIIAGTANTAGLALGGARLGTVSGVTAPAENFAARTYLNMVDRPQYISSAVEGTMRLNIELGGRQLFRAADNVGSATFGEFASVQRPASPAQAIQGNALSPAVTGNQASQLYQVSTRFGFSVEGVVAPQGAGYPGGFTQVIQVRPGPNVSPWSNVQNIGYGAGGPR